MPQSKTAKRKLPGDKDPGRMKNIDKVVLQNFYKLAHNNIDVRLTAARSSIKILNALLRREHHAAYENLNYCISRLVAGLASPRDSARNGFSVLLLEILETMPMSPEKLIDIADDKIGHINKDSTKDILIGWYLLINILFKSGKLTKENAFRRIYSHLVAVMKAKSYMEIPVANVLHQYSKMFLPYIEESLPQSLLQSDAKTKPIDLFMALLCQKNGVKVPQLETVNINVLVDIAKACNEDHPLIMEIIDFILRAHPEAFATFSKHIHEIFFVKNHNKLACNGLTLINNLLIKNERITDRHVKYLLTAHVIRFLIVALRQKKAFAQHWFNSITTFYSSTTMLNYSETTKRTFEIQYAILDAITSPPGSMAFDSDSRSSVLHDLLTNANSQVLKKFISKFNSVAPTSTSVSQLAYILRRPQMIEENEITHATAVSFLKQSYFEPSDAALRESFKQGYQSIIEHIISGPKLGDKVEYLENILHDLEKIMCNHELVSSNQKEVKKVWSHFIKKYRSFKKKPMSDKRRFLITELVFLYLGLISVLDELEGSTQLMDDLCLKDESDRINVLTGILLAILSTESCSKMTKKFVAVAYSYLLPYTTSSSHEQIRDALLDDHHEDDDEKMSHGSEAEDDEGNGDGDEVHMDDDQLSHESEPKDEDEEDEIYMDDEQMFRLDKALAEVFKTKKAQLNHDTSFRLRVLELVKIAFRKLDKSDLQEFKDLLMPALLKISRSGAKDDRLLVEKTRVILKSSR